MARRAPKPEQQSLALERVRILFAQAERALAAGSGAQRASGKSAAVPRANAPLTGAERARELVALARRVATRSAVTIPAPWSARYCKRCSTLLGPTTSRVRTSAKQHAIVVTCLHCSAVTRRPYRKERAARAAAKKRGTQF